MKTMYIGYGSNIVVNTETQEISHLDNSREAINRLYEIDEDTHIIYGSGDKKRDLYAKAGDILVEFYDDAYPNRIILINSLEWSENLKAYKEVMQKQKEEWAKKKACDTAEDTACPCPDC